MTTKFIHCTPDADNLVAYMARVSNFDAKLSDPSDKLIRYLIKHKHWSPFEMVSLCIEIDTTRDISAQIIRHRSFSFQELSQRYAQVPFPLTPDLRTQDTLNRQNSIDNMNPTAKRSWQTAIDKHFDDAYRLYESMLQSGIAKECARKVLPMNTPTRIYMHGTARSWIHYIDLRSANGTQKEHQEIALGCRDIFKQAFPAISKAVWPDEL